MIISTASSRKTWAERQDEDEVKNAKGIPAHLKGYMFFILKNIYFVTYYNYYSIAGKLATQGTSVAPPECSAHLQKASVLPPTPTISSSRARIDREPEITAKAVASYEDEDSGDSSESSESDSAKHSDGSGNSNSHSGHDSDSNRHAEIDAPPICIGPPKSKSKQKPTESIDVTTIVPNQGIRSILYLSSF